MSDKLSEERLLRLVDDYISGRFTIESEAGLIEGIINLTSPVLSSDDVFEVLFGTEEVVATPEEGVAALRAYVESKKEA